MKQILQHLKNGKTELVDVPAPSLSDQKILIESTQSLLSLGTEKMLVDFGSANILNKALKQPDKVKQVLSKLQADGVVTTIKAVNNKLNVPIPLGYCNVGVVKKLGKGVRDFKKGDRVVSNGPHAELISVSKNLCAAIPDSVSDDEASFVVPGAIALNGIRLAKPMIGEGFVIFGLGLIGLLAVQILKAHGCKVLGIDFDESKLKLAKQYGAQTFNPSSNESLNAKASIFSQNNGVDGVLICTSSDDDSIIHQAASISRKRGRIILIGTSGLKISRDDFYEKELIFQVSCSYGPGRYDETYEDDGIDYPIGFVRWTEKRNFEAVLQLFKEKIINIEDMVSKRFDFCEALKAYEIIQKPNNFLGLIFLYQHKKRGKDLELTINTKNTNFSSDFVDKENIQVSFLGAGNYSTGFLMPIFKDSGVILNSVLSESGLSASVAQNKFKFLKSESDHKKVIASDDVDAIVISTRHDSHATFVVDSLNAKKHIFVEKPLCINHEQLENIVLSKQNNDNKILMVGFNRRFSPHIQKIFSLIENIKSPKSFTMNINAGNIEKKHWLNSPEKGGGRLIGEVCHFVDLLRYLSASPIIFSSVISSSNFNDSLIINLKFEDGSIGSINYFINGHKTVSKERLEVFVDNKILFLDNYSKLRGSGWKNFRSYKTWSQDKGQKQCIQAFINSIKSSGNSPVPFDELVEVTKTCIDLSEQIT